MNLLSHEDVKRLNEFLSKELRTSLQYECHDYNEIMPTYHLVIKDAYLDHTFLSPVAYSKQFEECVRKWCKETVNVTDLGYVNSVQKIMVFNEEGLL